MRQVAMFVVGFVVVAMAGVAVAQTSFLAGDPITTDDGYSSTQMQAIAQPAVAVMDDAKPPVVAQSTATAAKPTSAPTASSKDGVSVPAETLGFAIETQDGTRTESPAFTLTGSVTPGGFVWSGDHAATVDGAGGWTLIVPLLEGKNVVHVGAKLDGAWTQKRVTVYRGEPLVWAITQKVGASKTPVEKFTGTGSPGMVITASSAHGSATTTIGKSGEWWLEVGFGSTPGTTFPVTVTTSTGWSKTYTFSHLGETKPAVERPWTIEHKYAENHEPWTKFFGTGVPGTRITATSPYGAAETEIGKTGEWHLKVWFEAPQGATFEVQVTNSAGYQGAFGVTILASTFEVTQLYGTCAEDPPYDVFTGRTAPHTWVKAWSEFGIAKVESDADGRFELTVFFESAPYDSPFTVELIDGLGNSKSFSFVRTSA